MKNFVLTVFLYSSLFASSAIYAADNTLLAQFPANQGTYKQLILENLPASSLATICSGANSAGILYMNPNTHKLEQCAKVGGTVTTVTSPEECFMRYCSTTTTGTTCFSGTVCPTTPDGQVYTQARYNGQPLENHYTSIASYTVYVTPCCGSDSAVLSSS